jgi:tetraacyldisaccharide 4'-kinase
MKLRWYLWPFAWLYGFVVYIRNYLFDLGWKKSRTFKTAIIAVGNLTTGGTGKTPHVEYIIGLLQQHFSVAMVSRGYKRKSRGLQVATPSSDSRQLGDEPYQIYQKFPRSVVVADANRCRAIDYIEKNHPATDVVVLDDAFQHRYVQPGLSVLLIDYNRLVTNDKLLPVGNLRESAQSRYRASVIIITKCPTTLKPIDLRNLYNEISPRPYQRLFYSTYQYNELQAIYTNQTMQLTPDMEILVVSGIAQPKPMLSYLSQCVASVTAMSFPDHHHFTKKDWEKIQKRFNEITNPNKCIVVTEKDAAKLCTQAMVPESIKNNVWALPIKVSFLQDAEQEFNKIIIDYVDKNKRNS